MWFLQELFLRRRSGNLPFKMRNITQSNQQECRESIKEEFENITRKLPALKVRLKLKDFKTGMHDNYKDIFGNLQKVSHPIFTQDEIAGFSQNLRAYIVVLIFMILFESILYSLMAGLFISKQHINELEGIQYIFGFSFALIFVVALHFAFKNIYEFFEAKHLIEINSYDIKLLKPFYIKLFFAILICLSLFITVKFDFPRVADYFKSSLQK